MSFSSGADSRSIVLDKSLEISVRKTNFFAAQNPFIFETFIKYISSCHALKKSVSDSILQTPSESEMA